MRQLGRLFCCDKCGFRPFHNSKLETDVYQFVNCLIDVLVPFQLLDWKMYEIYYDQFLKPNIIVGDQGGPHTSYLASRWRVLAMHFFVLTMNLWGTNLNTRYMHCLTACGEHWFEMAYALHETPRNLFGNDGMESINDVIKRAIRENTCKFGGVYGAIRTLQSLCVWRYWMRHDMKEGSGLFDCAQRQNSNNSKQIQRDLGTLTLSYDLKSYLKSVDNPIRLASTRNCDLPLVNRELLRDDVYDVLVDNEHYRQHKTRRRARQVPARPLRTTFASDDEDTTESEDSDEHHSPVEHQSHEIGDDMFHGLVSVYHAADDHNNMLSPVIHDDYGQWQQSEFRMTNFASLKIGRRDVVLRGEFKRLGGTNYLMVTLRWRIKDLYAIATVSGASRNAVYLKFCRRPIGKVIRDDNVSVDDLLTQIQQYFHGKGKVKLEFAASPHDWARLEDWIASDHPLLKDDQRLGSADTWSEIAATYDVEEQKECDLRWKADVNLLMGNHTEIHEENMKLLQKMAKGGTRQCATCKKNIGWYRKHCVCQPTDFINDNVSNNVTNKLTVNGEDRLVHVDCRDPFIATHGPNEYDDARHGRIPLINNGSGTSIAQLVIEQLPSVWSNYAVHFHGTLIKHFTTRRKKYMYRVRKAGDWEKYLRISVKTVCATMNIAMNEILMACRHVPALDDEDHFMFNMFGAVSGIVQLHRGYYRLMQRIHGVSQRNIAGDEDSEKEDVLDEEEDDDDVLDGLFVPEDTRQKCLKEIGYLFWRVNRCPLQFPGDSSSDWIHCGIKYHNQMLEQNSWSSWNHYISLVRTEI